MGNDGGSIPDRRDLVKSKKKAEQADKANQTRARWGFCALSKKRLQEPVVSCRLGRLYNKDALIEFLLDRTSYGDGKDICGHVRSLKDVKELRLTANPIKSTNQGDIDAPIAPFVCPLTMKEMNGAVPFGYIHTCGCVFSLAGLKAVASTTPIINGTVKESAEREKSLCPQCGAKYDAAEDVFTLNPDSQEEELMMERLAVYLASTKGKTKKRKSEAAEEQQQPSAKRLHLERESSTTTPATAKRSLKLAESLAVEEKKRVANMTDAVRSIYEGKGPKGARQNWISQGTFTRYAA